MLVPQGRVERKVWLGSWPGVNWPGYLVGSMGHLDTSDRCGAELPGPVGAMFYHVSSCESEAEPCTSQFDVLSQTRLLMPQLMQRNPSATEI